MSTGTAFDNTLHFGKCFFQIIVNYNMIIGLTAANFLFGLREAVSDDFGRVGAALFDARGERVQRGRADEHQHRLGHKIFDLLRALRVQLQDDVAAAREFVRDPRARRAVEVAVDLRPFQELAGIAHCDEAFAADEEVVFAFLLAFAGRARGMRDGDLRSAGGAQAGVDGRLAGAGGRGDDKQSALFGGGHCGRGAGAVIGDTV